MKLMNLIAITAIAFGATASQAAEITIYSDYDGLLNQVGGLNNACISGDSLQSIKPISVCQNLVHVEKPSAGEYPGESNWLCESYETKIVNVSRSFNRPYCSRWNSYSGDSGEDMVCAEWALKNDTLPKELLVAKVTGSPFSKKFALPGKSSIVTIPDCE